MKKKLSKFPYQNQMWRDEGLGSSAVEMAVLQPKVHVDKWHLPTFVPRNTVLMSFSIHGVTQRMDEFTHSGRRVQPLQPLQAGTSVLIQSLSWIFSKDILWPKFCPGHHGVLMKVMVTCLRADFGPICHMGAGTSYFFWMSLLFIFVFLLKVQMKS